jgi:DNA-binding MarR family transcriptional regulator/GNAT superfamily N-acetyltransferase
MPAAARLPVAAPHVELVRRFNRSYTRLIGVLDEGWAHTDYSLTEARIIYELAQRPRSTASEVGALLGLDAGYLSRLLRSLAERGLLLRRQSDADGRQTLLSLSAEGRKVFGKLDARSRADVTSLLARLGPADRRRLVSAMRVIDGLLHGRTTAPEPYSLRPHRPGDIGWVIHRQTVLYHEEYGWTGEYEMLMSRILADFLDGFDPARERSWIAERDGEVVGSVFVVRHPERPGVARLRLLYVEPSARGLGIGARLVQEVTRFAREAGYHTITLWTNSVLVSARRLYEAEGYRLVHEEPHHSFGKDLVGQTWELAL